MINHPNKAPTGSDEPIEQVRDYLSRALAIMDEIDPASIPAARLQQIIDELPMSFGAADRKHV